ncbi:MAG: S8 family serine peptidase [Chloroflexi bacterium]|nr:S8 family serine peptidase [Chloroflexota bacterium]
MKSSNLSRFFAVTAVLMAVLISIAPASAQSARSGDDETIRLEATGSATDHAYLRDVAEKTGSVRVIVGLEVNQPGRMAFETMSDASQRAVIAQTQDALLSELGFSRSADGVQRYAGLPMMAISVNAGQFDLLTKSTLVTVIQENRWRVLSLDIASANVGMTGASGAWASGADGTGQHIVILDSGVEKAHPFLVNKVVAEACFSSNASGSGFTVTSLCPGGATSSMAIGSAEPCSVLGGECSHGTHIAGIAAGKGVGFSGIAKEAHLISIQVFSKIQDDADPGTPPVCVRVGYPFSECILAADADILAAMDYAWTLRDTYAIAAVNMSLGNELYTSQAACDAALPLYRTAVDKLVNAGIAVVSSSGNQGRTDSMNAPACITGVTSVGATCDGPYNVDADPEFDCNVNTIAPFTNSTAFLSFMAPGVSIDSADDVTNSFTAKSGTSQATPFVSGAIAAIKSYRPGSTQAQIRQALYDSGVTVSDIGGIFKKIQVDAALDILIFPDEPILLDPQPNEAFAASPISFFWKAGDFTSKYTLKLISGAGIVLTNVNVPDGDCGPHVDYPSEGDVCTVDITWPFKDNKTYQWKVVAKYNPNDSSTESETRSFQFDTPGQALLISPANKITINQPEELFQFQWSEVDLATSYRVTLYDTANGSVKINTPELAEGAVCASQVCTYTTTPADLSELADDRKYRWYVTSISVDGTSQSLERRITAKFPAAPLLLSPVADFRFTSLNDIELTWTEVATATSYRLKITDTSNNTLVLNELFNVGPRTITCTGGVCTFVPSAPQLPAFKNKRTYSWTVTAANALGDNTSAALTFRTKFPAPPVLIAPISGLTFDNPAITFQFTEIDDADSYELHIHLKTTGVMVIQRNLTPGGNLTCNGTDCSHTLNVTDQGSLKNGKIYTWFVKSVSTAGKSSSAQREFTFQSPLPPALIAPVAGAKLHSPTDAVFSWSDVGAGADYVLRIKDKKSGAVIIKVDFDGASCAASVCTYALTANQQDKLKDGRDYRWWVSASNTVGTSKSEKRTFKAVFPRTPTPLAPINNVTFTDVNQLAVMEWVSAGTSAPVTYKLRVKRTDTGAVIYSETVSHGAGATCGADTCLYNVQQALRDALGNNRTYKWWIVAESADGVKAGAKFKFKTNFS